MKHSEANGGTVVVVRTGTHCQGAGKREAILFILLQVIFVM